MTPALIRTATTADLAGLVQLQNAASPELPTTLAMQEFRERDRKPGLAFGRLVAEQSGHLIGVATFSQPEWSGEAGKLWVGVTVHPDFRRQGVGAALYNALQAEMKPHSASKLSGMVREDRMDALRFAASRGFVEVAREQDVELTLADLDTDQRAVSVARARAGRYDLLSFADHVARVGDTLAWKQLYDLDLDSSRDVPLPPGDSLQFPALERYRESAEASPTFDSSLWFVAVREGEMAGVTQLSLSPMGGRMDTGYTGVGRLHRGHRLAWALKYLALEEAQRRGATAVRTTNDALNLPMRNINAGLGFLPVPAFLTISLNLK